VPELPLTPSIVLVTPAVPLAAAPALEATRPLEPDVAVVGFFVTPLLPALQATSQCAVAPITNQVVARRDPQLSLDRRARGCSRASTVDGH
jgi:hypothetical protein